MNLFLHHELNESIKLAMHMTKKKLFERLRLDGEMSAGLEFIQLSFLISTRVVLALWLACATSEFLFSALGKVILSSHGFKTEHVHDFFSVRLPFAARVSKLCSRNSLHRWLSEKP